MPDASTAYSVGVATSKSRNAHLPVESAAMSRRVQATAPSPRTRSSARSVENPVSDAATSWSPPLAMVLLPGATVIVNARLASVPAHGVSSSCAPVRNASGPPAKIASTPSETERKRPTDFFNPPASTRLPDSAPRRPSSAARTRRAAIPPAATRSAARSLISTAVTNAPPSDRSCSST